MLCFTTLPRGILTVDVRWTGYVTYGCGGCELSLLFFLPVGPDPVVCGGVVPGLED
jgi:hypothetical protein